MKICVLSGNPKNDGLCQTIIDEVINSAKKTGAEIDEVRLADSHFIRCQVCGEGWGTCRDENFCSFGEEDGFNEMKSRVDESDALVIATPVYWGETSEALKSFIDRLRRCEFGNKTGAEKKQVLLIASAGGSGNGILTCLEQMDRFCRHMGFPIFDYIGVNRWNADYKKTAAGLAAHNMAIGRKNGDTV